MLVLCDQFSIVIYTQYTHMLIHNLSTSHFQIPVKFSEFVGG